MQQSRSFEQKAEIADAARGGLSAAHVFNAREQIFDLGARRFQRGRFRAKNDPVGVFYAEGDFVAGLEFAAADAFAVYENAQAMPAVFEVGFVVFRNDGG